jgi:hypothetical protein
VRNGVAALASIAAGTADATPPLAGRSPLDARREDTLVACMRDGTPLALFCAHSVVT